MELGPDEVQIVKGPGLTVTDKRILGEAGEIAVSTVSAPEIEERLVRVSAAKTVISVGAVMLLGGLLAQFPLLWIAGAAVCAFGALAKVNRRGFAVTAEIGGERRPIYSTGKLEDARLAHAAVEEALRRSAA